MVGDVGLCLKASVCLRKENAANLPPAHSIKYSISLRSMSSGRSAFGFSEAT